MAIVPSPAIWGLGWTFLIIGLISLAVLVIYTKYGREISIRLSIVTSIISVIFLAFALHFLLLTWGL